MKKTYKYYDEFCKQIEASAQKAKKEGWKELQAYLAGEETPRSRVRAAVKRARERLIHVDRVVDMQMYNRFLELGEIAREAAEELNLNLDVSADTKHEVKGTLMFSGSSFFVDFPDHQELKEKLLTLFREATGMSVFNGSKEFIFSLDYPLGEMYYSFNTDKTPGA